MDNRKDNIHVQEDPGVTDIDTIAAETNPPSASPSLSQRDPQSGIDIRQALDILSSRPARDPALNHNKPLSPALKSMGQTIDLFAASVELPADSPPSSSMSAKQTKKAKSISTANTDTPVEQRQKIRESLRGLPLIALLKTVLTAQEDRVRAYRLYDEALGRVLVSNRLTDYPPACAAATAAFAVLSNTVSAVRDELSDRANDKKESSMPTSTSSSIIKYIKDLQSSEREKLQLTAAYHLERIRANNLRQPNLSDNFGDKSDDDDDEADMRELSLFNKGIADLRSLIQNCVSDINDTMEDLRCALVEQIEEEERQ